MSVSCYTTYIPNTSPNNRNLNGVQKEEEYQNHLHLARQEQMGPLSAASMEMGSYHRGYEYILRYYFFSFCFTLALTVNLVHHIYLKCTKFYMNQQLVSKRDRTRWHGKRL